MNTKVDMTYRFLWDVEPTDEQLLVIMQEVAEEARHKQEELAKQVTENIRRAYILALAALQNQQE